MDPTVIAALVASVPATLAATAAWRHSKRAAFQTNGMLHEPLARIEDTIQTVNKLLVSHITDVDLHAAAARAAAKFDRADAILDRADQVATQGQFDHDRITAASKDAGERA